MTKTVLVIDDAPDIRALEDLQNELEHEVNIDSPIEVKINLQVVNPLNFANFKTVFEKQLVPLYDHLDERYLGNKLDMLLCDFNLHAVHKHLAFRIISHVRLRNKACTIILFSGSPLKELIRLNNSDLAEKISSHIVSENSGADVELLKAKLEQLRKDEDPAEELLVKAVESKIDAIVPRVGVNGFEAKAIKLITKPSLLLYIENQLTRMGDVVFNDGNEALNGKKFSEVAKMVREQNPAGVFFTDEIIQACLSNLARIHQSQ